VALPTKCFSTQPNAALAKRLGVALRLGLSHFDSSRLRRYWLEAFDFKIARWKGPFLKSGLWPPGKLPWIWTVQSLTEVKEMTENLLRWHNEK
jgi:hypothetical protein